MADPRGFLEHPRLGAARRPVAVRLRDWREVYQPFPAAHLHEQAARCMDCGIPFCHEGCPLGNLIPDWNDLVWRGRFAEASERLHATNNFPEFTGRLCPAPCEGSCVLGISDEPVAIKQIEVEISEWAFRAGAVVPLAPRERTGKRVAVVGSGPAGLACAQQLARAGHGVVVFERAERVGGLLRYGIPEFKMEKAVLDRRLAQLEAEGVEFRVRTAVGLGGAGAGAAGAAGTGAAGGGVEEVPGAAAPGAEVVSATALRAEFDALVLAGGSTRPRELDVPGRHLRGVHPAMELLKPANLRCEAEASGAVDVDATPPVHAGGKRVIIVGGGDTGADCLGTVHRQGASSVHQLEILPRPPDARADDNPWPTWPLILRVSSAHEEGGERLYAVTPTELVDDGTGAVRALRGHEVRDGTVEGRRGFVPVEGSEFELPCELVLLAMGFLGPEQGGVVGELGLALDARGNVACDGSFMTSTDGVFACGDMARGQSLIVWAIAEGRSAAASVDRHLMGTSDLPSPIIPGQLAIR
jgi:glutamate synthase (NADPH/NADH) small chain